MKQAQNRGGRPPSRQRVQGDRVPLGLRVSLTLKNRLDQAARDSGRSQSQEAELRLEMSFDREEMIASLRAALSEKFPD